MMDAVMNGKLVFGRDQIVSSSQASKNFGEIRKRARKEPLFCLGSEHHRHGDR